jgi:tetratricopeptide (TPR) repeat protein
MEMPTSIVNRNKKICLNMIVKNESKIIVRMLKTVLPLIDYYCICDTGSTDNTIETITNFFDDHKITGKIIQEPFKDFGYNRTYSLQQCSDIPADYILLLDADMILDIKNLKINEFKSSLTMDAYCLFQGTEDFYYKNIRIVKNNPKISYWGVTHEYVKMPEGSTEGVIEKNTIFINDIGDGGAKTDKFERDIRLLKQGLEENPNDVRYTFYLANSYRDSGQYENAIETYKKRIDLGGWIEEIWQSYYAIGVCYRNLNDMPNAIFYWMKGYEKFPDRIENMYEIIKYFRETACNKLANMFYEFADFELKKKTNFDHLFLQKDVYSYKLDYEFTINGYYVNRFNKDIRNSCMKVLNEKGPPRYITDNVLQNYKSYAKPIKKESFDTDNMAVLNSIGNTLDIDNEKFVSSTPSISIDQKTKTMYVCVRYVDYKIGAGGEYVRGDNITTKNIIAILDISNKKWVKTKEFELKYDTIYDDVYIGIEDVRLFSFNNKLYFNGNRAVKTDSIYIEYGTINLVSQHTLSTIVTCEKQQQIEKNWVIFKDGNKNMKMIYNWFPLSIGTQCDHPNYKIDNRNKRMTYLNIENTIYTPPLFKYIRGSTNGINIGNEIWFICHVVSYEDRRYYYHTIVVLDDKTYELKRFTKLFTFDKEKVEYTLGFEYFEDKQQFMIGYSTMDSTTKYIMVSDDEIRDLFYV